jgi:hypothetical protein
MSVRLAGWWQLPILAVAAVALLAAAPPEPSPRRVAALVEKLGDEDFDVREQAQEEIRRLGQPCAPALARALRHGDLEVRKRSAKLLAEIDPSYLKREKWRPRRRAVAEAAAEVQDATDATAWGESIANPFTALTDASKKRLRAEGVDVGRLLRMRARLIVGDHARGKSRRFVNLDADVILVFGKGFSGDGDVHSVGPVLAVEDAHFMAGVRGAGLVWLVDQVSHAGRTSGAPLVVAPAVRDARRGGAEEEDVVHGDLGWKAPADFGKPLLEATPNDPPATEELAAARKKLLAEVKKVRGVDVRDHARPVVNPFTNLTDLGKKKLKARGIDVERLGGLKKALYLTGDHRWADRKTFVNTEPDTVLVLGKGFVTHGPVFSLGPVLAVDGALLMAGATGADVVWFAEESCPCSTTTGAPVILQPTAGRFSLRAGSKHVWHGDYGWRRPDGWPGIKAKDR